MAKKFQSTHPRGVRRRSAAICAARISFQSTHPRGVRRTARLLDDRGFFISIHAPARGATHRQTPHAVAKQFQSTHPRGVRRVMSELLPLPGVPFQSTHPRGVRRAGFGGNSSPEKFQSTHQRGVRPLVHLEVVAHGVISIHAPARGATAVLSKKINDFQISRSFFFCGAVQAAHWARKPTLKPHIRRTLAKRPVQQTADPALSRPKMRDLRPDFGANPSAIL